MTKTIAAIVVTHNRIQLLKECIDAIRNQSYEPTEIIVINNNSSDGTKEWLEQQSDLRVFHQANLGGAGGFHRGIREAYTLGYDWFWCMDDDTIPQRDALHSLAGLFHSKKRFKKIKSKSRASLRLSHIV